MIGETIKKSAIVRTILGKHRAATNDGRFNALFATSSINDAIEYYNLFKKAQFQSSEDAREPLNIACVFTPPAEGNRDIAQYQEDLLQERLDNQQAPEEKKAALMEIIKDYKKQFGTNHSISDFDAYYQDIQQRIKNQQYSNKDYAHKNKIDITIVVDMLLTGFDSKYLNTLYVDKNLKYHGLVQAFSRTNRILNDTKPYGTILDFRGQREAVDRAIALFSGEKEEERARQIWLVEPASEIQKKFKAAVGALRDFMSSHHLPFKAEAVPNLQGDEARAGFIQCFKNIQRLRTQLDQYTDLVPVEAEPMTGMLCESEVPYGSSFTDDDLKAFRGAYLDLAQAMKSHRESRSDSASEEVNDLDFEFVLFASALIDYDYIMDLVARHVGDPLTWKMTRDELIGLIRSSANLLEDRDDIIEYINSLDGVKGKTEKELKEGYEVFKTEKYAKEMMAIADKHKLSVASLTAFINDIVERKIFDGEKLNELLEPLNLGWRDRTREETALVNDLAPLLQRLLPGQDISGLSAYDE